MKPMLSVSVSDLNLFRTWNEDEDLDLGWLLTRLRHPEQTAAMKAGEAFHKAIETVGDGELEQLSCPPYVFQFDCDCEIVRDGISELRVNKEYGDLQVRGRVDHVAAKLVTDYKTTAQFDADRLMDGFQWRYYLDMMDADIFRWDVFVLREGVDELTYSVSQFHRLEQRRYPQLNADCSRLAAQYVEFAKEFLQ